MAQNDRQGGSTKDARPVTDNEQISLADRLKAVLAGLKQREGEIAAVLPVDITFNHFHATVNQALRNNPDVLKATYLSIVNACVKAAYDGLRLDGREAALVTHNVKVSTNPDRWETQAQYFPMVFGLIQQVLRGGEVIALEASIIYENDQYHIQRGTNPGIQHVPLIQGDRGKPIAAYSIATYRSGYVGFEFMTEAQILDVRASSRSGQDKNGNATGIWKRWPDSMWKKTVIRQHRKTLPLGGRDIRDAEEQDEFEAIAGTTSPALNAPPPRPTRGSAAIEHQPGSSGVDLDFGGRELERSGPVIDANETSTAEKTAAKKEKASPLNQELPEDEQAWTKWAADVERRILAADTVDAVRTLENNERTRIDAATDDRRDFLKSLITDRLADLASEAAAEQATGSQD
jgi:recombination protein RecT